MSLKIQFYNHTLTINPHDAGTPGGSPVRGSPTRGSAVRAGAGDVDSPRGGSPLTETLSIRRTSSESLDISHLASVAKILEQCRAQIMERGIASISDGRFTRAIDLTGHQIVLLKDRIAQPMAALLDMTSKSTFAAVLVPNELAAKTTLPMVAKPAPLSPLSHPRRVSVAFYGKTVTFIVYDGKEEAGKSYVCGARLIATLTKAIMEQSPIVSGIVDGKMESRAVDLINYRVVVYQGAKKISSEEDSIVLGGSPITAKLVPVARAGVAMVRSPLSPIGDAPSPLGFGL